LQAAGSDDVLCPFSSASTPQKLLTPTFHRARGV
jgi:hypothetical protein